VQAARPAAVAAARALARNWLCPILPALPQAIPYW